MSQPGAAGCHIVAVMIRRRASTRLSHDPTDFAIPNILAIHDFGSDNGVTYAVMELLEGHSLRDALAGSGVVRFPS